MSGKRRPDGTDPTTLRPGQYTRRDDGWWARLPDGHGPNRLNPETWTVTEHTDGTITVTPSILCRFTGWHGWLRKGTWEQAS